MPPASGAKGFRLAESSRIGLRECKTRSSALFAPAITASNRRFTASLHLYDNCEARLAELVGAISEMHDGKRTLINRNVLPALPVRAEPAVGSPRIPWPRDLQQLHEPLMG